MWFAIAAIVILAIIFLHWQQEQDDIKVLQHTITVNLSILNRELAALTTIASQAPASAKVEEAQKLLDFAKETARTVPVSMQGTSSHKLTGLLEQVFNAMSASSDARHLLDACDGDWTKLP